MFDKYERIVRVPMRFTRPLSEILAAAARLGRENGHGLDWVAPDIETALCEILMFGIEDPDTGVEVLHQDALGREDIFVLQVKIRMREDGNNILREELAHLRNEGVDQLAVIAMQSDGSPVDFGFEIKDWIIRSTTAHELMAVRSELKRAGATLDV